MNPTPLRRLKIGLVTPFFLPQIGGANLYCHELARHLAQLGHEVHVFTVEGALEDEAYTLHPILTRNLRRDLQVLRQYDMDVWHALFFFYAPLALYRKNVCITGHGDDCFSFQLRLPLPGRAGFDRTIGWRLPAAIRAGLNRAFNALEWWYNLLVCSLAVARAHRIITVSSFTRNKLAARYPHAANKTVVIPPGVSERFFQPVPPNPPSSTTNLLTVCRLDAEDRIKNVHGVVEALAGLRERDFVYRIVSGSVYGSYRREIAELIDRHGLAGKVRLEGRKTDEELLALYRSADLFILVSYAEPENFEGFGIVFLEANACGVPVLTSREGGMADYVVEGENGCYVDDPSPAAIRRALRRFLDGDLRFDPGRVRQYPQPYRWRHIAERVAGLYPGN